MMSFMKTWCEGIIVAVIISIIIETILPEGTNKKYVKVVVGIYIIFTVLNPIIGSLNNDIDISNIFDFDKTLEVSVDENDIKEIYIDGIKSILKEKIEQEGFQVLDIDITYDNSYENIEKIILKIRENDNTIKEASNAYLNNTQNTTHFGSGINTIEKVQIGINENTSTNQIADSKIEYLKKLISETYGVSTEQIFIN